MKRALVIGAVVATAVLAVSSAIFGPEIVAGYRFMEALDQHYADYQADGGAWPQLQDSCALCHGERGQSSNAQYASLAGLPVAYIESQLHAFAEGRRHSPQMSPLAASLSDQQIQSLAAYFARQTAQTTETPPRRLSSGEKRSSHDRRQGLCNLPWRRPGRRSPRPTPRRPGRRLFGGSAQRLQAGPAPGPDPGHERHGQHAIGRGNQGRGPLPGRPSASIIPGQPVAVAR